MLKQTSCGLTPDADRERWGLPASYLMVAPGYAERRSALAKSIGLGRKRVEQLDPAADDGAKPARRGREAARLEAVSGR
jgi:predicted transcriptional regulator